MKIVEAHGARIPALGFGTWQLAGDTARRMVMTALEIGYRHIDTAQMYGNEAEVGQGIRESGLARDDIFLTTKIWPDQFKADAFRRAARERLELLKLEQVDLLLLHWPNPDVPLAETIEALNRAKEEGLTRHVGVSNFNRRLLDEAVGLSAAPIVTNQVEYHPFLDQTRLLEGCRGHGVSLTAYCPLARGRILDDPTLTEIARRHGRTVGQVTLRWFLQQDGVIAIPRTSNPKRAEENFGITDFELSDDEMRRIHGLGSPEGRVVTAMAFAPEWD